MMMMMMMIGSLVCIALYYELLISKALRLATIDHIVLAATHMFIPK